MKPHTSGHRRGVVAAPHHAAAEAGRAVLADGGNALEVMVAMAASIAAVYPHMNHIGGDGFWVVREPNGRVRAIMAPGPAGAKATIPFYKERGYDTIPPRGPLAALTVPGAIGGWAQALEAAKSLGGKMPLDVLLEHAINRKVAYVPGSAFHPAGDGRNTLRLNFSFCNPEKINEGIKRLGQVFSQAIEEHHAAEVEARPPALHAAF